MSQFAETQHLLQRAVAHHQTRQWGEAQRLYREVLARHPGHPTASHHLGVLCLQGGAVEEGLSHLRTALGADPAQPQHWISLVGALAATGRREEMERVMEEAGRQGVAGEVTEALQKLMAQALQAREGAPAVPSTPAPAAPPVDPALPPPVLLAKALEHHQAGRLEPARGLYRRILELQPDHADALHLLGVAALQGGDPGGAVELIGRAIAIDGNQAHFHSNLGNALRELGRPEEAAQAYQRAVELQPDFVEALSNLGNARRAQGRLEEAATALERAVELRPDFAGGHLNLGNVRRNQGRLEEAVERYRRAVELQPGFADALGNLGGTLGQLGRAEEAQAHLERAVALDPTAAEAQNNLGNLYLEQGRVEAAMACYERVMALRGESVDLLINMGNALQERGGLDGAAECYRRALALDPDSAGAHMNLGNACRLMGRLGEAEACHGRAIALDPGMADVHNNLGNVYKDQGRVAEAAASYQRAVELRPDYPKAHSNLLFCHNYDQAMSDAQLLEAHREWDRCHARALGQGVAPHSNHRDPERRLRVGYVSRDFGRHPVSYFLEGVWAAHDPERVEIYAYSDREVEDDVTERLKGHAAVWVPSRELSDGALARRVRADGIDILVDLAGHTANNRLLTFARRPAPVQVSWLGYFHTTGLEAMDAILMDPVTVPPGGERWFAEEVLMLPGGRFCYTPPDYAPAPVPPPCGEGGGITFGSFNNLAKLTPEVLGVWARVLAAVPGSRLVLKWKGLGVEAERERVRAAFVAAGGEGERLELRGASPHPRMLAEYGDLDVALDPFPYCGGLTSAEALWMGVPVLTLPGSRPVSRQTLAFLTALGLEGEWAADSVADYVARAAALTADRAGLAALRAGLRPRMARSPLCDAPALTRHLEGLYRQLWQRWCGGM